MITVVVGDGGAVVQAELAGKNLRKHVIRAVVAVDCRCAAMRARPGESTTNWSPTNSPPRMAPDVDVDAIVAGNDVYSGKRHSHHYLRSVDPA